MRMILVIGQIVSLLRQLRTEQPVQSYLAQKFSLFMIFSTCNPRQNRFCIDISFLVVVFHVSLHHQSNLNGFCCFHCWLHYYKRKIIIKTGNIFYIEKNLWKKRYTVSCKNIWLFRTILHKISTYIFVTLKNQSFSYQLLIIMLETSQ